MNKHLLNWINQFISLSVYLPIKKIIKSLQVLSPKNANIDFTEHFANNFKGDIESLQVHIQTFFLKEKKWRFEELTQTQ